MIRKTSFNSASFLLFLALQAEGVLVEWLICHANSIRSLRGNNLQSLGLVKNKAHCIPDKYKAHSQLSTITLLRMNNFCDFNAIFSTVFHHFTLFMHFRHAMIMHYFSQLVKKIQLVGWLVE